jgi:hypothetical protein
MTPLEDPDLSATLLFLGAVTATVALPLIAFRLPAAARRVALGAGLGAGSGFAIWIATQPVNDGLQWPLLYLAGLAIGDAALLFLAPRVASLLAILAAVVMFLVTPLLAQLMARSFISIGSEGPAAFSTWILFAGVYSHIVFGIAVLVSSTSLPGRTEGNAPTRIA